MVRALAATLLALAWVPSAQALPDDPPRLRTILPNGATILVERIPGAPSISAQLFLSARGNRETNATNGYRHLLEHLIATGRQGDLDVRLETDGLELRPRTLRDAMVFEIDAPPGTLSKAISAFAELAKEPVLTQERIDREVGLIQQEGYFRNWMSRLGEAAWQAAYPDIGGDPFGSIEAMKTAAPERLLAIYRTMFAASNCSVVVAGDVDLDQATSTVKKWLEFVPAAKVKVEPERSSGVGGNTVADAHGIAIGLPVATYRDPSTAAELAVALYVASEIEDGFVTYTPSSQRGLLILGGTNEKELQKAIRDLTPGSTFLAGRDLARRWVDRQLTGAPNVAFWRGLLLVQERDLRPETLRENIEAMTLDQIKAAIQNVQDGKMVWVRGSK